MRKIGILGGTFHPVHVGHLRLAIQAKENFALDEMWLMPAAKHHLKEGEIILPGRIRADLLRKAVAELSTSIMIRQRQKEPTRELMIVYLQTTNQTMAVELYV